MRALRDAHRRERKLVAAGTENRPHIVVAEQAIGGAAHMREVFGMRADAAQQAEYALHEERRLDEPAVDKMRKVVQVRNVVALVLEARAVIAARSQDVFDIGKRVLEHK